MSVSLSLSGGATSHISDTDEVAKFLDSDRFLFEGIVDGSFRSCLVTGDLRAEPWYIDSLLHNPLLAPYTTLSVTGGSRKGKEKEERREVVGPTKELDCIYLDTSNVLLDEELVEKVSYSRYSTPILKD